MRWSLRATLLAIVLPLTLATLVMSAIRIAELATIRDDIAGLRDSAFRSIYAERYARYLRILLKESYDHLAGRSEGLEAIASARAGMVDTLERLHPFVHADSGDDVSIAALTPETLLQWEETQDQIDVYLGRAIALVQKGESARARRLVTDDLEVLVRGRIFASVDDTARREQELLEEYRVRFMRATQHWLARYAGAIDLRERLLMDVYEAVLAERFIRHAYSDLEAFTRYVLEGRPLGPSHGVAAGRAIAQLSQLQQGRAPGGEEAGAGDVADPGETHALIRDAYARTLSLPAASLSSNGPAVLHRLDEVFERSLLPQTNAIVWSHEQSIEREMTRLDHFAKAILSIILATAGVALLLVLGSPFLASWLLVKPVDDLVETVASFRAGEKEARPRLRANNELGVLSRSLQALLDELHETDRKVRALAFYDSITGLPNRQFFEERLAGALTTARLQNRTMGLLSLNILGLKQINDTLGHKAGDDLIRQVAARLRESVRLSDVISRPGAEDVKTEVSRLEGDEFSILLTRISKPSDTALAAQRVLSKVAEPIHLGGREMVVSASVGIGIYPQDGGDAETLLRNASAAMNHALARGGNHFQFYSEAMNTANSRKLHIQSRLNGAIDRGDLMLYYQPMRDAKHGRLSGAEALLRWTDSEMGPIGPDEFVPIAEHAGLISQIGRWVLNEACVQASIWQEAGYPEIRMSVNVSASQLREVDWVETVAETLRNSGLSPGCLELEITETTIIQDDPKTNAALKELSQMGVGIVLDDFGTGYSSLSHLRRLPINRVKIDRSFVSEITDSAEGAALTSAIVTLAHSLRLSVVAEGVETHEQANFLRNSGCEEFQGYLISRAVSGAEFERFLKRQKSQ